MTVCLTVRPKRKPLRNGPKGLLRAWKSGRGGAIRTLDLLNPIQVRYQAAPRPEADESTSVGGMAGERR